MSVFYVAAAEIRVSSKYLLQILTKHLAVMFVDYLEGLVGKKGFYSHYAHTISWFYQLLQPFSDFWSRTSVRPHLLKLINV